MDPTGADRYSADRFKPPTGADRQDEQGRRAARPHIAPPFFAGGRPAPPQPQESPPAAEPHSPAAEPMPPPREPPMPEPSAPLASTSDRGADVEFPWEAPVPELLLTDVIQEPASARTGESAHWTEEAAAEWTEEAQYAQSEETADFIAGAGIGDYEREPDGDYDEYGDAGATSVEEPVEAPGVPELEYFAPQPLEAPQPFEAPQPLEAPAVEEAGLAREGRELADELETLADALRRDGLAALDRAVRGHLRLQALVAAVLVAYTASPSEPE